MNPILALPSLIALVLVLWYGALAVGKKQLCMTVTCLGAVGVLVGEISFYLGGLSSSHPSTYHIMVLYYLSALIACLSYFTLSLQVSGLLNNKLLLPIVVVGVVNCILVLTPNAALQGVREISYGLTRIPGPYYWVVQITVVSTIIAGFGLLLYTAKKSPFPRNRQQAYILLMSSSLFVAGVVIIVLLMQLGFEVSGLLAVPLFIIVFMGVQLYAEYETHMFKLLSFIPQSNEQMIAKNTIGALLKYKSGDMQGAVDDFERGIVVDMVKQCDGNKSLAAKKLGISRATLRRKIGEA